MQWDTLPSVRLGAWSSSGRSSSRSEGSFWSGSGLGAPSESGKKQRSIAARSRERRQYRVEVAALGDFEVRLLTSIGRLMIESEQWVRFPPDVMTVRYRALTFRLLARAGSTVHALLQVPHEEFLFRFSTMLSPILPSRQTSPSR